MNMKIYIYTQRYDEKSGGTIVLHKLCSVLNELGYDAALYPCFERYHVDVNSYADRVQAYLESLYRAWTVGFVRNPAFNTPVVKVGLFNGRPKLEDDCIVIYPESIYGNPLKAARVVRWLLHEPGFHGKRIGFGKNEIYFKFNDAVSNFEFPGSLTSDVPLKVIHYPLDLYNEDGVAARRSGTAYCLRKGKGKEIVHDLHDSILIDDLSHAEVAKIFKRVKRFVSYDTLTAYSIFAVLCGCESVVVPDEGVSKEQWYPDPKDRYGISYGFDELAEAATTANLVTEHVVNEERQCVESVRRFVHELERFFG